MVYKKVANADPGTISIFGGDDFDKVADLLNGVLDVDAVDINTSWTFQAAKLIIGATSWANATHAHLAANSGGQITEAAISDLGTYFDTAGTGLTSSGGTVNVIGTASRITANANDIDIASDYVGQTSITTLGTITTGVWQGTAVASAFLDADTMHLSVAQTVDGAKTFQDDAFLIQNPAATFEYLFQGGAIVADRTITLPVLAANSTMAFADFANAWGTQNQNIAATGKWQEAGVNISPIGVHDIWIGATAMWPLTTAGSADLAKTELATNDVNIQTLDFDTTTEEHCQFTVVLPRNWNNGTVTATFHWTNAAGLTTETVDWAISGVAFANDDALDTAFGTEITTTDTWITQNDLHISAASSAITIAGSPADGEMVQFQIARKVATDDLTGDAKLIGIVLHITTDAATAA